MPALPSRGVVLGAALLVIYIALMFAFQLRGTVGADTGPKVATLHSMQERSTLVPDVSYWAKSDDPQGILHPLYATIETHGRYVAVTTLPMIVVAEPLYCIGGDRLALLLPMLGAVGCAF